MGGFGALGAGVMFKIAETPKCAAFVGDERSFAVLGPDDARQRLLAIVHGAEPLARFHIPDEKSLVSANGDQFGSVRFERDAVHRAGVALELVEFLAFRQFPDFRKAIGASACSRKEFAVRADADVVD